MLTRRTRRARAAGEGSLAADLAGAALVAFLTANFALSYAALLFAGTAPSTQAAGLVIMLTTGVVLAVAGAGLNSLPFALIVADGSLIAILASASAGIVAQMRGAPAASVTATLTTGIMLASIVAGVTLALTGVLRAGGIVRYLPFQVTAGILAATGWSLSVGGIAVATGHPAAALLTNAASAMQAVLAALVATAMLVASSRLRHPAALPAVIIAAFVLQHAAFAALGWTLGDQRRAGWLLAQPPSLHLALPWSRATLAAVNWPALADQAPSALALIPIAAISLLLAVTGIEAATGCSADVDRDLKANGAAAVLSAALGGMAGTTSLSRTILLHGIGVRGWRAGVLGSLVAGLVPLLWPGLIGTVPRSLVGGLLLFAGLGMLQQWVVRSRRRLTRSEWLTVLAVLAIAARFGLVAGVFAGLLLGCVAFAAIYSRASPIRAAYRGNTARSNVERSEFEQAILAQHADSTLVLHLHGFIFFGTANRLVQAARDEIAAQPGRLRHLVVDFSGVDGIDGSALYNLERLQQVAAAERIALVLTSLPAAVAARLAALPPLPGAEFQIAGTLDEGLDWGEERILAGRTGSAPSSLAELLSAELDDPASVSALIGVLQPQEVPAATVLMRQGDLSDDLFFIESGRASILVRFADARELRVRSYGAGTMVGEIGFVLGLPRTATVRADQPCKLLRLTRDAMDRLQAEHPAAALDFQRAIIRRLSKRLVDKDQLISALVLGRARGEHRA